MSIIIIIIIIIIVILAADIIKKEADSINKLSSRIKQNKEHIEDNHLKTNDDDNNKTIRSESRFVFPDGSTFVPAKSPVDDKNNAYEKFKTSMIITILPFLSSSSSASSLLTLLIDVDIQNKIDDIIRKSNVIQKVEAKIEIPPLDLGNNNFDVERMFKKNLKKLKCLEGINNDMDDDELDNLIGNLKNVSSRPSTTGDTGRINTGRLASSLSSSSIALDDATRHAIYSKSPRYINDSYNDYSNHKMINNYIQRPRSSGGGAAMRLAQNGQGIINNNINNSSKNNKNSYSNIYSNNYNNNYNNNHINDNEDTYSDYGL